VTHQFFSSATCGRNKRTVRTHTPNTCLHVQLNELHTPARCFSTDEAYMPTKTLAMQVKCSYMFDCISAHTHKYKKTPTRTCIRPIFLPHIHTKALDVGSYCPAAVDPPFGLICVCCEQPFFRRKKNPEKIFSIGTEALIVFFTIFLCTIERIERSKGHLKTRRRCRAALLRSTGRSAWALISAPPSVLSLCTPMAKSTSSPTILGTVQHRELSISLRPISTRVFASSARCHTCTSRMHVYFPAINVDIIQMHAAAILFVLVGNCTHSCLKSAHFHTYFLCMHACDWGTTQYIFMCAYLQ